MLLQLGVVACARTTSRAPGGRRCYCWWYCRSGGGGGASVNYYLNGGTSQGTFGGTTYYEFSKTAVIGTGADFSRGTNGYIASFITDVADPSLLLIPAGNWNLEFFFNSSFWLCL